MLHTHEKKFLYWLIPIWVIACIVVAMLLTTRNLETALNPQIDTTWHNTTATSTQTNVTPRPPRVTKPAFKMYVEVTGDCGPSLTDACVIVRNGPSASSSLVAILRTGIVLHVADVLQNEEGTWYSITFDEWLRYPARVTDGWYIQESDVTRLFIDQPVELIEGQTSVPTTKEIILDRGDQMLYAYENGALVLTQSISTGISDTPTPRGVFTIYRKTPSRYMQGPLPGISTQYYDLPGVPWNLYFTKRGAVIHGAYWHDQFGTPWSHGCVNMPRGAAEKLYHWADLGTIVLVQE